ncbi:seryl-tRNA synthetase [Cypionkella aquatica]|uniref:Seryl-tRNA synthetase n=1 Tax=Cypionkella aquatica TaxID=1756042 RepID=A0AA37U423_9RHOB|nr:tryptophan-rich sensory protein [Cypionkella aquatica]GLS87339.1 seryl-tRNA synthetase [Cypionkella aquatica]
MKRIIQPALLLATLAFAVAPAFTPSFRGYDPATFPVQIAQPSVQPAGYAFAIWGLIYLWLIAHAGFGLIKRRGDAAFIRPALALTVSVLLGTVWLAIAVAAPIPAAVAIVVMAATAIYAYLVADPVQDRWLLAAPLAIYAGWLTAASAVSTGVIIAGYGILPDTTAALAMLGLVLVVAIAIQIKRPRMPIYGATIVWAIVGIVVKSWGSNATVAYAALAGAVIMACVTLVSLRGRIS